MKKALQVTHFWAKGSLPDGAAVRSAREARSRSLFYRFAQFFRLDPRRPRARLACVLERGLERLRGAAARVRRACLRKRTRREPQPRWSILPERLPKTCRDLARELGQLERPGRGARGDMQGPISREPRRPGIRSDGLTDGGRPGRDQVGHHPGGAEAAELTPGGF